MDSTNTPIMDLKPGYDLPIPVYCDELASNCPLTRPFFRSAFGSPSLSYSSLSHELSRVLSDFRRDSTSVACLFTMSSTLLMVCVLVGQLFKQHHLTVPVAWVSRLLAELRNPALLASAVDPHTVTLEPAKKAICTSSIANPSLELGTALKTNYTTPALPMLPFQFSS